MTVSITDRRTIIDDAESTTGWTGVGFGTTSSDVAEQTNAVAEAINIGNAAMYYTDGTSTDLSTSPGTLVYVYAFNNALQPAWDNSPPPMALLLGDGTDRIAFDMAGSDRRVFNHLDGPTNWQCLVLDTADATAMNSAGNTYVDAGSFAGLNFAAITQWGARYLTQSKALGGGYNVATDIIRYGNDGIRITDGTSGAEGTFSELAIADRSTADGAAHGIFRELNPVSFGCQGPLTFGDSGAATESRFIDSGVTVAFEDRNIANDKYYFNIEGNSGTTNVFELRSSTITTAGPFVSMNMAGGNIDTLIFDSVSFVNLGNGITFSNSADATGHSVTQCTFDGCGRIDPGDVTFSSITIQNSNDATGAVLLDDDGAGNWSDLGFIGGTGHGILIDSTGTYTFNNISFSGFGATDSTLAAVYNNSGGAVTINISGGDSPTVRNGSGASTTVLATTNVTISNLKDNTEVRIYETGTTTVVDGIENATDGSPDDRSFTFSDEQNDVVDIVIHSLNYKWQKIVGFTIPSSATNLPIQQEFDRNYANP